jgi:hypothetical protein
MCVGMCAVPVVPDRSNLPWSYTATSGKQPTSPLQSLLYHFWATEPRGHRDPERSCTGGQRAQELNADG